LEKESSELRTGDNMGLQKKQPLRLEGEYDFLKQGGLVGVFELISVPENFVVSDAYYEIETPLVSGGTPTVTLGDGVDPDGYFANFQSTMGVAGVKGLNQDQKGAYLWDGTEDAGLKRRYAAADTIDLAVGTAALTAGKLKLVVYGEVIA
jgi:hypothetical protein